jgi:copper resistance protein C
MQIRDARSRGVSALLALSVALGLTLAAIAAVAQAPTASAHAEYESSVPAANSTVTQAPAVVTVHFGEEVNPTGSDLIIYDTQGKVVSTSPGKVDTADAKTMTVPMTGDDSESYLVVWHSVSLDDGDPAVGAFIFNVGDTAKPGDGGGTTTASGTAEVVGSSSPAGTPGWVVALVGIVGLIVGTGATLLLVGRRKPPVAG